MVQTMACRLNGANPLSEPNAGILLIGPLETNFSEIVNEIHTCRLENGGHFVSTPMC